jgi:hypothetical protein
MYRYTLRRTWEPDLPVVLFVGLNPSTADETHDDPTIRRCVGFARRWGYGGLIVVNLFAWQTTDPRALRKAIDPVGLENDAWILRGQEEADRVVAAWGNGGTFRGRAGEVLPRLREPYALGINQSGQPVHPLYVRGDVALRRF